MLSRNSSLSELGLGQASSPGTGGGGAGGGSGRPSNSSSHIRQPSKSTSSMDHAVDRPCSPDTVSSNSTIRDRPAAMGPRIERRFTVTVNESFPRVDEVLLNLDQIGDHVKPGTLVAISVLRPEADKPLQGTQNKQHAAPDRAKDATSGWGGGGSTRPGETEQRYIFLVKDLPRDIKARYPTVEVYVAKPIADAFGMKKGSQVTLTPVCSC